MTKDHIDGFNAGFKPLKGPIMVKIAIFMSLMAGSIGLTHAAQNCNLLGFSARRRKQKTA
jgi:hypothetical protein